MTHHDPKLVRELIQKAIDIVINIPCDPVGVYCRPCKVIHTLREALQLSQSKGLKIYDESSPYPPRSDHDREAEYRKTKERLKVWGSFKDDHAVETYSYSMVDMMTFAQDEAARAAQSEDVK